MICYLGDDDLNGAAGYLAAVLGHARLEYHHIPSRRKAPDDLAARGFRAYILSDYPAAGFSSLQLTRLAEAAAQGAGLLMIGGWESFFGRTGEYRGTPLEQVLPVYLTQYDDRVNCPQGCVLRQIRRHPILDGLPWELPPVVAGYNRLAAKPEARTLLVGTRLRIEDKVRELEFSEVEVAPVLVVGKYGQGRTAALACDVAPHWVGGMVDWGQGRIVQHLPHGGFVEMGPAYAEFLYRLVAWIAGCADWPDWYDDDVVTVGRTDSADADAADTGTESARSL
ncbi:MAG: hypothetical protein GYA33_04465 [Thermogutta sp.]|nr:hypothetical protein [Thermogutta sp.]